MGKVLRKKTKTKKKELFVIILHAIALLMFCWRSLFEFVGIHQFVYVVIILLAIVNLLFASNYHHKANSPCWIYFVWGVFIFISFLAYKGLLVSGMGFVSIYLIFLVWMISPLTSLRDDKYYNTYLLLFVLVMVINSFISVYQFFVDPSVFGLVTSRYGDESLMSMDQVTRRTVGFMGSPQSFSASMGVSLFLASKVEIKELKLLSICIIIIGGLLSGSRAFGLYLVFFVFYLYNNQKAKNKIIITIACILLIIVAGASIMELFSDNETLSRNFTVRNWAAKSIFFSNFRDFQWIDYIIGRGYGLEGWGNQSGNISFDYSSTESAFLSIVYQTGVIGGLLLVFSYVKIYLNSYRTLFCRCLMIPMFINMCVTPAFVGFAYSYIAWGALFMLNNKKIGHDHE